MLARSSSLSGSLSKNARAVRIADYDLEWRLYVTTSATRPTSAATRALLTLIGEVVAR